MDEHPRPDLSKTGRDKDEPSLDSAFKCLEIQVPIRSVFQEKLIIFG